MAQRFIAKRPQNRYIRPIRNSQIVRKIQTTQSETAEQTEVKEVVENKTEKKNKNEEKMDTKITKITQILDADKENAPKRKVRVEKKDKGLFERTENSTILLTEDDKMVLND